MKNVLLALVLAAMGLSQVHAQQTAAPSESSPQTKVPLIIPRPKLVQMGSGTFRQEHTAKWILQAATRDERLWAAAKSSLRDQGSFEPADQAWTSLTLGSIKETKFRTGQSQPRWASDPEGYQLTIETNGIQILASTSQGAFYGLQTLAQLWRKNGDIGSCPVLKVEDWPSLRFRGVHWFPSATGVSMHLKIIEDVLGPLKLNRSVIQCEGTQWEKHPEITAPNAVSKADLQKLVDACRSCFVEPIPLINVPGHAEWIFRNNSHLDLAEDPKTPYAYCVNNPKSYAFLDDVLGECLPIFKSKFCHLGHDEVTMRGRFPNPECPRCKGATTTGLIVKHANRVGRSLNDRGIETMIWGDMLLGPGEANDATHASSIEQARKRRAGISTNTIIVDWHYVASADAQSLNIFRKQGFRVIAATWSTPENIRRFSQAAVAAGAEGLLQTTWMGYFPDEEAFHTQLQQFAAFVLAAEYAWSGRDDPPSKLGYEAQDVFANAYRR